MYTIRKPVRPETVAKHIGWFKQYVEGMSPKHIHHNKVSVISAFYGLRQLYEVKNNIQLALLLREKGLL